MTHASAHAAGGLRNTAAARTGRPPLERPAPLRQAVYDMLVEMIITRELQPGQHLVEHELAAQLGVSRQPVREALQRLHSDGWVDLRPALGAFVHIPTDAEADQLLAVRTLLEAESARLAAKAACAVCARPLESSARSRGSCRSSSSAKGRCHLRDGTPRTCRAAPVRFLFHTKSSRARCACHARTEHCLTSVAFNPPHTTVDRPYEIGEDLVAGHSD